MKTARHALLAMMLLLLMAGNAATAATVHFGENALFEIEEGIGSFSAEDRAAVLERRLLLLADAAELPRELKAVPYPGGVDMLADGQILFSVSDEEAAHAGILRGELAAKRWTAMRRSVLEYREARSEQSVWVRSAIVATATLLLYAALRVLLSGRPRLEKRLQEQQRSMAQLPKDLQGFVKRQTNAIGRIALRPAYWLLLWSLAAMYAVLLLRLFPRSIPYAEKMLDYVVQPAQKIAVGIADYLPNLVTIALLLLLSRYTLKAVRYIAEQLQAKEIVIDGFDAEWGKPTYNIVRFLLLALTLIAVFPYLPAAESPVFQGISVFIGLLISLGSSSVVSNVFSGFILVYTRAYRIGDQIMVGSHFGRVVERSVLATRLLTPKNETVTLPNATMLSSNIINYSAQAETDGLILHTEVTIGYAVPWRQVHALLAEAAANTEGVLTMPKPFVLQTALSDFYVKYELNAFTRAADQIPLMYSRLHQNIQDAFQQAGIEIMSPHYAAWRNGETTVIPASER